MFYDNDAQGSLAIDTPMGVLSRLNISEYDRVIINLKKRHAGLEEAKRQYFSKLDEFADNAEKALREVPELEASGVAEEYRRLEAVEHQVSDGIVPNNLDDLDAYFKKTAASGSKLQKIVKKFAATSAQFKKTDNARSIRLHRICTNILNILDHVLAHYRYMSAKVKDLKERAKNLADGPVYRALRLYIDALEQAEGVHEIGELNVILHDRLPLYELPIKIDTGILMDRRRLAEWERAIDHRVEQRDPSAVGAITFRFEPIAGAA